MFVAVSGSVLRVERKSESFCRMTVVGKTIPEPQLSAEEQLLFDKSGTVILGEKLEVLRPKDNVIVIGDHRVHGKYGPQVRALKWWLADRCPFSDPSEAVENYRHLVEDLKLTPKLAEKLFTYYLCDTKKILSENPYLLVQHGIKGITIKTVDEKIAPFYAISKRDMRRLKAAILDTIKTARTNGIPQFVEDSGEAYGNYGSGHTYVDFTHLVCHVANENEIPRKAVKEAILEIASTPRDIDHDQRPNIVVENDDNGPRYVYEWSIHRHEQGLGLHLRRLLEERVNPRIISLADKLVLPKTFTLTSEQESAVRLAFTSKFSIITGGPGVGKTTIVQSITDTLREAGYTPSMPSQEGNFHLCAFTGIAADRISKATGCHASTIHKLLKLDPQTNRFTYNKDNPLPAAMLICDEASMISLGLMSALFDALPSDAHVVFVGDVDQLPPIDAGAPFRDLIEWGKIPTARLSKIHRQVEGSLIIRGSQNIIRGEFPPFHDPKDPDLTKSDLFVFPYGKDDEALKITKQLFMEKIPKNFHIRPEDIQIICPLKRRTGSQKKSDEEPSVRMLSSENVNLVLQEALTGKIEKNRFNVLDRVVQTTNDYRIGAECNGDPSIVVMNGEIGRIVAIYDKSGKFPSFDYEVEFRDGKRVYYNHEHAQNLELAYALSVHKMQGQEAKAVIILAYAFMSFHTRQMLYTAVTRGKQLVIIVSPRGAADMRKILASSEIPRKSRILWRVDNDDTDYQELEDIDVNELSGNL